MSKDNAISAQQQQQHRMIAEEEDKRGYYDYELNHQPKNNRNETSIKDLKVGEYANVSNNEPLSKSAPSNSWMENDQLQQPQQKQSNSGTTATSASTSTKHRRGVSSSDLKNASGPSSNVESMIRRFSFNEQDQPVATGAEVNNNSNRVNSNNQTDNKRSKGGNYSNDYQKGSYDHQPSPHYQPPLKQQQQPYYNRRGGSNGNKSNPYFQDNYPSMRPHPSHLPPPPPMPIRLDQLSIQDIYAIIEENQSLQMEKMELQRRLRHVTARANYLEELKSGNSPEEYPSSAADITKPYGSGKRHLYYKRRSNTNKGQHTEETAADAAPAELKK